MSESQTSAEAEKAQTRFKLSPILATPAAKTTDKGVPYVTARITNHDTMSPQDADIAGAANVRNKILVAFGAKDIARLEERTATNLKEGASQNGKSETEYRRSLPPLTVEPRGDYLVVTEGKKNERTAERSTPREAAAARPEKAPETKAEKPAYEPGPAVRIKPILADFKEGETKFGTKWTSATIVSAPTPADSAYKSDEMTGKRLMVFGEDNVAKARMHSVEAREEAAAGGTRAANAYEKKLPGLDIIRGRNGFLVADKPELLTAKSQSAENKPAETTVAPAVAAAAPARQTSRRRDIGMG